MIRYAALALILIGQPAAAQVMPTPTLGDPRLQTMLYDPDQIVRLSVASGYQLMVAFSSGEKIETIAVGDSSAWQVTGNKRGDAIFIKSVQPSGGTNLTVVTDARVYAFELVTSFGEAPYIVRFTYPAATAEVSDAVIDPVPAYCYRLGGARAVRPRSIVVDGERVSIEWPKSAALPAIFRIDEDGAETLINGAMVDGRMLIDGAPMKLIFRLDRQIATATRAVVRVRHSKP